MSLTKGSIEICELGIGELFRLVESDLIRHRFRSLDKRFQSCVSKLTTYSPN